MSSVPPPAPGVVGNVPNHLAWAIIATVLSLCFCCIVGTAPGVVAIVFSNKVNTLLRQGDLAGAQRASATARTWCWVTTALVVIGAIWSVYSWQTGGMQQYMQMMEQIQAAQG